MFASSFVNVCIVWIRVLERSCLARMAKRYMVRCLERLSISTFCMSAAADLKVVRVCLKRMKLSNFVSLEPAEGCTDEGTAKHLLNWCKTMGVPRVRVSDTATHFKNRVTAHLSDALKVDHRFAVAYTPWSNGTCERMVREVVRALKSILSE